MKETAFLTPPPIEMPEETSIRSTPKNTGPVRTLHIHRALLLLVVDLPPRSDTDTNYRTVRKPELGKTQVFFKLVRKFNLETVRMVLTRGDNFLLCPSPQTSPGSCFVHLMRT